VTRRMKVMKIFLHLRRPALEFTVLVMLLVLIMAAPARAGVSPERQTELFYFMKHDCGSCHGLTRKGGLGSSLLPEALAGRSDEELTDIIMDGVPDTPMPPWRSLFNRQEAGWMVRALKEGRWK